MRGPSCPPTPTDFAKNLPAWSKLVAEGKKTAPDLLATLSTRASFSEEQKAQILALKVAPGRCAGRRVRGCYGRGGRAQ